LINQPKRDVQNGYARVSQRNRTEDTASVLSPELGDAADVLSDRLREQMQRRAAWAEPHTARIDRAFLSRLRELGLEARQRNALTSITTGAAARLLRQGQPLVKFIEQVEYNGRLLAKLNLPPSAVLRALKEYDRLWIAALERPAYAGGSLQWMREQLHFASR
jgi:hypothetical protein